MDNLTKALRSADPLAREPELSSSDVAAMRQRVLAAAAGRSAGTSWSWRPALAFAIVALMAVVGTFLDSRHQRAADLADARVAEASPDAQRPSGTTQVQFETPGGTRIVWVLNPNLSF